jgi:hypothetical protein
MVSPARGRRAALRRWRGSPRRAFGQNSPWCSTSRRRQMPITSFILCSTRITVRSVRQRLDQVHHHRGLLGRHAGGGLVHQQQLRVGRPAPSPSPARVAGRAPGRPPCERAAPPPGRRAPAAPAACRSATPPARCAAQEVEARVRICAATRTFSCALNCLNTLVIWKLLAMPSRAYACCGRPVTSSPRNSTLPVVGASAPLRMLKKVLLPAPLGPMMAHSSLRAELRT